MGITKSTTVLISLISCLLLIILHSPPTAASFKCSSDRNCTSIIDYVSPNATTYTTIINLFNISNLHSFLGVNNLPLSTSPNQRVTAKQTVKIPIPCICSKDTGKSNKVPVYKVVPGDGLDHIAREVFSGLVTFQEIQAANNISDADVITEGQELYIPLPCSCDDVGGERVVHYGHVVSNQSTVEGIAQQYHTTQDVLLRLNDLATPNDLKAGAVLDVPLKACTSNVRNNSPDFSLLVPNGTYALTARDCVMCNCHAANNWSLQCEPSQLRPSSIWQSCPLMQCQGAQNLFLGSTTSSGCNRTTCSYAGYDSQRIHITPTLDSTCPAASPSDNNASAVGMHGWMWNFIVIAFHLMLPFIHFH